VLPLHYQIWCPFTSEYNTRPPALTIPLNSAPAANGKEHVSVGDLGGSHSTREIVLSPVRFNIGESLIKAIFHLLIHVLLYSYCVLEIYLNCKNSRQFSN